MGIGEWGGVGSRKPSPTPYELGDYFSPLPTTFPKNSSQSHPIWAGSLWGPKPMDNFAIPICTIF